MYIGNGEARQSKGRHDKARKDKAREGKASLPTVIKNKT